MKSPNQGVNTLGTIASCCNFGSQTEVEEDDAGALLVGGKPRT